MKLENKIFFFVSILTLLSACNELDKSDVFSEDQMTNVLVDIHLLEAKVVALKLKNDSMRRVYNTLEHDILSKYNVDKAYYEKSYRYYLERPELLQVIYDRVVDSLNVVNQNAKFEEEQYKEEQKRKKKKKEEEKKAERERLKREKEGLPPLEDDVELPENERRDFIGPRLLVVRTELEEFEFLLEQLKKDSIATHLRDSLALEFALVDSILVDSTVILFDGPDSMVVGEIEKKITKIVPKLPKKKQLDSTKEVRKKIKN